MGRDELLESGDVSRETFEKLDIIIEVLDAWRLKTNLVGPKEWPKVWERHVDDSLQLVPMFRGASRIVDLGSGAGFPGLVIAAALPGLQEMHLVESVGKKCAFLRAAADAAELPVRVHHTRIESMSIFPVDAVTARALAPLSRLLEYSFPWLKSGAFGIFPKGENAAKELTDAEERWSFTCEMLPSRTSDLGQILKISEVSRRDEANANSGHR